MSLNRFTQFVHNITKYRPVQLGRWSTLTSSEALQKRIDLANIDHCGPCTHQDIPKDNGQQEIHSKHFDIESKKGSIP
jgi:hypothetical protein